MKQMSVKVASLAGFCFGVDRAVRRLDEVLAKKDEKTTVYTLGALIHNPQMISHYEKCGVITADPDDIEEIYRKTDEDHRTVILLRAHGIERQTEEKLRGYEKANNFFTVTDCTCPYVKKIHRIVESKCDENTPLIVIGSKEHPEVKGILSYTDGEKYVFSSSEEVAGAKIPEKNAVAVAQTTQNISEWKKCQENIKKLCTNPQFFDTICTVTENRQNEVGSLSRDSDIMLIIGGKSSSNTNKLYRIAKQNCPRTYFIENLSDLPDFSLQPECRVGIAAGASTPMGIIKEVETIMNEKTSMEGENFAELLEQSFKTLHTGETVKGVITAVSANEIFVDLGTKTTGVISTDELSDDASAETLAKYKVGDEIEAIVVKVSDADGVANLSRKKIERLQNWSKIVEAYNNGEVLTGKIVDVVKGGVIISVKDVRVFIPASHTGLPKDADVSALRGTTQKVKIIELDESRNRAIASIRVVLREERKAQEEAFWSEIEEGKRYEGTVKSIKSYGAFVDLGGVSGMVHITELSWSRIKNPSEVVKEGQKISVYVKSFDRETGRISLGYKAEEDDPWLKFKSQYNVNDVVSCKIMSLLPFGAFAEIIPGADGLIHISQIANKKIAKPADVLNVGDVVDAKITEIDDENRKISLSIRALIEEKEEKESAMPEDYVPDDAEPVEEDTPADDEPVAEEAPADAEPVAEETPADAEPTVEEAPADAE